MDRTDDLLRELGQGTPFPVDWQEYERDVMRRLARAQAARRRRAWWFALAGAGAGAAAMLLLTLLVPQLVRPAGPALEVARAGTPTKIEENTAVPESVNVVRATHGGKGMIRAVVSDAGDAAGAEPEDVKPFTRRVGKGEIRFEGFSTSPDALPGFIVAGMARQKTR